MNIAASPIMTDDESLRAAIEQHVELTAYRDSWPYLFVQECGRLSLALRGQFIAIEHIGSTAVKGMAAKPIIDILVGVKSMAEAESSIEPLCCSGYTTSAEFNATLSDRKWLMRFSEGRRTHHLHVTVLNSTFWQERLLFRDVLRASSTVAAGYTALKLRLAAEHKSDREAYTNAKTEFIRSVTAAA